MSYLSQMSLESLWQPAMCTGGDWTAVVGYEVHEGCSQILTGEEPACK